MWVFFGSPGASKGTLAGALAEEKGYAHWEMSKILDKHRKQNPVIDAALKASNLGAAHLAGGILQKELLSHPSNLVLDGFPRTEDQCGDLVRIANEEGYLVSILYLILSRKEAKIRMMRRGREPEKVINQRLDEYYPTYENITNQLRQLFPRSYHPLHTDMEPDAVRKNFLHIHCNEMDRIALLEDHAEAHSLRGMFSFDGVAEVIG